MSTTDSDPYHGGPASPELARAALATFRDAGYDVPAGDQPEPEGRQPLALNYGNLYTSRFGCVLCDGPAEWGGVQVVAVSAGAYESDPICDTCAEEHDPELFGIAQRLRRFDDALQQLGGEHQEFTRRAMWWLAEDADSFRVEAEAPAACCRVCGQSALKVFPPSAAPGPDADYVCTHCVENLSA